MAPGMENILELTILVIIVNMFLNVYLLDLKKNCFNSIQFSLTNFFKIVVVSLIFQNFFWLGRAQLFRMIRKEEY